MYERRSVILMRHERNYDFFPEVFFGLTRLRRQGRGVGGVWGGKGDRDKNKDEKLIYVLAGGGGV